ncbi:hypothetical protein CEXT_106171 [Caerostris extrusa]|uniref:Uncharacterized protein n=1 Tax=Caerostris extrusa TaxID=172846 RepID=A0AAV4WJN0_CAEEX|nr:hypothetical protein CEXT_106171 [Caerostris extrusa]
MFPKGVEYLKEQLYRVPFNVNQDLLEWKFLQKLAMEDPDSVLQKTFENRALRVLYTLVEYNTNEFVLAEYKFLSTRLNIEACIQSIIIPSRVAEATDWASSQHGYIYSPNRILKKKKKKIFIVFQSP